MRLNAATLATLSPWFPDADFAGVRIVQTGPVCWFVRSVLKQGAMTVSPFIFYGRRRLDLTSVSSLALLAHELRHIEQYRRMGHVPFLLRYLGDLIRARFRYSRDLPLEAECYDLQAEVARALGGSLS
jgi:hypothetical protein